MTVPPTSTESSLTRRVAHAVMVLLLLVAMAACGGDDEPPADRPAAESDLPADDEAADEGGGTVTVGDQEANDHGSQDVTGATEAELEADDFYFEPTVLTGEAGQELTLTITNEGSSPHNFSLTDQDIDEDLDPGDSTEVTVTFPDSGTLVFFCSFHQSGGMLGGLEATS